MPNTLAFVSYVLLTTFTPGPNNIMAMSNASRVGFRRGLRFNAGVFVGFLVIAVLALVFSLTLYRVMPNVKVYMTFVGAAYILWLAWKTLRSSAHAAEDGAGLGFTTGALLQLVNPKVILYSITIMATFVAPYYRTWPTTLGFAVLIATMGFIATTVWALFGSAFQRVLARHHTVISAVMAALLVYCAASLFFE